MGNIIFTPARGQWMGNRGCIHNDRQQIIRPYKLLAWLICRLQFKDRQRIVMTPNNYTELFFLDEATAFAAGHRPCAECRREDFNQFKTAWLKANPAYGFEKNISIKAIDALIHKERLQANGKKRTYESPIQKLPEGVFIRINEKPYVIAADVLYHWSPFGYTEKKKRPLSGTVTVLTPASIVLAFTAGYRPQCAAGLPVQK